MHDEIAWALRRVVTSPARLTYLTRNRLTLPLLDFLRRIVPQASDCLQSIRLRALAIPDPELRTQAVSSVDAKAFHVAGGCILATFLPDDRARAYVETIAPLETIYDYLDNLCDRHPAVSPRAYPVLHRAIADALDPSLPLHDYYAEGPGGDDGGYLRSLVLQVREQLGWLDQSAILSPLFAQAALLYGEMQTYKHLPPDEREGACIAWFERRRDPRTSRLRWYEFACAAGSQFHVYAPLYECHAGRSEFAAAAYEAHFPSVAALHVLLDSYIDQREDRLHGELNFTALYPDATDLRERAGTLAREAELGFTKLPVPAEHRFVLHAMALFYLTHREIYDDGLDREARALLRCI